MTSRNCSQCGVLKPWPDAFMGRRGVPVACCTRCSDVMHKNYVRTRERRLAYQTDYRRKAGL